MAVRMMKTDEKVVVDSSWTLALIYGIGLAIGCGISVISYKVKQVLKEEKMLEKENSKPQAAIPWPMEESVKEAQRRKMERLMRTTVHPKKQNKQHKK